jgi:hypothetical protein
VPLLNRYGLAEPSGASIDSNFIANGFKVDFKFVLFHCPVANGCAAGFFSDLHYAVLIIEN